MQETAARTTRVHYSAGHRGPGHRGQQVSQGSGAFFKVNRTQWLYTVENPPAPFFCFMALTIKSAQGIADSCNVVLIEVGRYDMRHKVSSLNHRIRCIAHEYQTAICQ